jgi:hypothetical protein
MLHALLNNAAVFDWFASTESTYETTVQDDSPWAYFRLGEASGTNAVDEIGNVVDMTYNGTPTLGSSGLISGDADTCVTFDGVNDFVSSTTAGFGNTTALTIEAWINLTRLGGEVSGNNAIMWIGTGAGRTAQFDVGTDGSLVFNQHDGAAPQSTTSSAGIIETGKTYHLVVTRAANGVDIEIWVNGVNRHTATLGGASAGNANNTVIGGVNATSFESEGRIDEVVYYKKVLTDAEILEHFHLGAPSRRGRVHYLLHHG